MDKRALLQMSFIAASVTIIMGCSTLYQSEAPKVSSDGMALKKATRSTIAYKKEGIDFSEYTKVHILPSSVAFKKNWKRDYNRDQMSLSDRLRDEDVIKIKKEVVNLFDETFKEEFSRSGDSPLVTKLTTGTLVIKPAIIDLDVNAPDITSASYRRTYASDSGSATLVLELYDGVSGEILVRILDAEVAGDYGYNHLANKVSNKADAKRMIRKWAKALRTKFDQAQNQ